MADGPASTIVFDGDSTGAVAALHAVDVAAKNTAASVKGTGAALGSIGDGADAGVNKAVAATSRFEAQLKRLNLELESGGRNTAAYIEGRAKLAGADTAALAPLIAQYDQLKAKQTLANSEFTKAGKVMTEYGMTVKGTSAALRQVPAQFTDIVVSLQGGQAPLTVLLQQGGQLKDVFGGVGNAAKALGGYILGLVNPLSLAAAAAGTLAIAYLQGSKEAEAYNKALITTGNAAGLTSSQLGNMAKSVAQATGGTLGAAAEALAGLAGSTGIASAQFERIAIVAAQMEKTTGQAVSETVKQFSELGNDPVKASLKLTETTRFLTAEVYNQIKALVDQGRELEAGVIAQNAWANAIATRTPALLDNLGLVQRAWNSIMGAAKGAWDAMLNVGRPADPVDKTLAALESARAKLIDLEKLGNGKNTMIERANVERLIQGLEQKQLVMQGELRTKELLAGMEKDGIQRDEASIRLAQARDKFAGKEVLMQRELAQARAEYERSNKSADDLKNLDGALAGIKKKYEETAKAVKTVREEVNKAAKEDIAAFKDMEALRQKALGDEMKRAEESLAAAEKTWAAYQKADEAASVRAIESAIAAETELTNYGLLKSSIQELELVRLQSARDAAVANLEDVEGIEKRIDAQKRLIAATRGIELRTESDKAAKEAAAEWKRTSDQINSALTDALMRGFESGKGFARNLRDTVVNMFKTMVLRPIISAVMSPISGAITGAMGLSGAASAATGVAGGAATGLAGTLAGFAATAASWGTAAGAGFMATLGGSTIAGGGAAGILATGGAAGASTAGSIGAAAPYALAAVAALAAFGAFRSTKQTGTGISGTLGDDASLTGFNEMRKSGYLFGGPKYWDEIKAIDPLMAKALKADFTAIKAAATGAADALGLASTSVAGFNKAFRIEFTGDKAKDEALYNDLMSGVSEDLAKTIIGSYKDTIATVVDQIMVGEMGDGSDIRYSQVERQVTSTAYAPSEFARDGETASQTLQRLATSITLVNGTSDMLGNELLAVGLKGANTASLLIDAFGGAERYAAQMGAYYQNFYTQEEQRAKLIENTSEAFTALGKTMPVLDGGARAAYRSMVELAAGQDMSVESNRTAYASLLALQGPMNELAPTFDSVAQAAKDAAEKTAQAAKDAALEQAAWQTRLDIATGITTQREVEKAAALLAADNATDLIILSLYAFEDAQTATAKATAKATEASRTALQLTVTNTQTSINSLVAMYGDLAGAVLEISQPTKTLVDQWRTTTTELTTLTQGLAQALGELPEATALDRLKATLATLASATNGIANISDQIFGLQVGRGDQAAVSLLQGREASLGAELATSNDPGAVAAKLATTMLQRIKLQGQLADKVTNDALKTQFDAATTMAQLEKTNREKQIAAIRDQISAAETLTGVVSSMRGYLAELRFGNLSALNPGDQLSAAQGNYATLLAGAQGGDTKAMQDLQGGASNYLQEAQGYYGGATSQYAGIFQAVTSGLEQFGATPVTDITLLKDQLTALEKIEAANLTLQTVVTDTTELQINGLNTINTTLTNRESEARQDAADNKKAVQDQIAELKAIVAGQEAQIKQQAAIYEGLMDRLTTATTALENIDRTTTTTAAAPV